MPCETLRPKIQRASPLVRELAPDYCLYAVREEEKWLFAWSSGWKWTFSEGWQHAGQYLKLQVFFVAQSGCASLDDANLVVQPLDEAQ